MSCVIVGLFQLVPIFKYVENIVFTVSNNLVPANNIVRIELTFKLVPQIQTMAQ